MHPPTPVTVTSSRPLGTTAFFVVAIGFTLALELPAVLALNGVLAGGVKRFVPLAGLGGFGPLIAALVLARGEPGGVRGLLRPLGKWRVHPIWYVVATFLPGFIMSGGLALVSLVKGDVGPLFFPPANAQRVVAMFLVPLVEEIGCAAGLRSRGVDQAEAGLIGQCSPSLTRVPSESVCSNISKA